MNDAGGFPTDDPERGSVVDSYFGKRPVDVVEERDGISMRFRGWAYPLEAYARALESAGFLIEKIREPAAPDAAVAQRAAYARWQRVPMFLQIRAVKA